MDQDLLLEVKNVSKSFGATQALVDINLKIERGKIHALLGRNGAGKSTLVNIIAGIFPQSSGHVYFEGKDIQELNIFERQEIGIRLVPQHENSFPELTVAENIFVGLLPKKKHLVDWETINRAAKEELIAYGLKVEPTELVKNLSSIDARKLNIIRAMYSGAKLIILDEPTTALTNKERDELFVFIRDLQEKGTAFIFISHYLGETIELADGITVLRDGMMYPVDQKRDEVTEPFLANLVAGKDVDLTERNEGPDYGEAKVKFSCKEIYAKHLEGVSLDLYEGEVLGVVGFPGSGAREFCRALFGVNKIKSGEVYHGDRKIELKSPKRAIQEGVAYISFDRHREGIIPQFTVNQNIGMSVITSKLKKPFGFIDLKREKELSREYKDLLKIKCNTIEDVITSLSGGNQQKVIVSRSLNSDPSLLILDEPTIGIDIQSREEIISTVHRLSHTGMSTIYLTNDYEELLRVTDRLVFFDEGKITSIVENKDMDIDRLMTIRDQGKGVV